MNNKILVSAIAALAVGVAGGFYGGVKYQQKKTQNARGQFVQRLGNGQAGNFSFSQAGNRLRSQNNGGFIGGEIIAKDEKSLTLKLMDGGSKIVYHAETTEVSKPNPIDFSELKVGDFVSVAGSAGNDGSVTAQTIQIRSALMKQPPK